MAEKWPHQSQKTAQYGQGKCTFCAICDVLHSFFVQDRCPAPQGAGGLKLYLFIDVITSGGPAPQGAGGLKYLVQRVPELGHTSRPARGGWIEISELPLEWDKIPSRPARGGWIEIIHQDILQFQFPSRPARGGWIEIQNSNKISVLLRSRPARGGWIEIVDLNVDAADDPVPPRKGRVD